MSRYVLAALMALSATAAPATSYIVTMQGTVTQQYATFATAPGATSSIATGDLIQATFSFDDSQYVADSSGGYYSLTGPDDAVFMLGGFTWTSGGDFLAGLSPPRVTLVDGVFGPYSSTMDDSPGGDLRVRNFTFDVGEFGYALYEGPGFRGNFDQNSIVVQSGPAPVAASLAPPLAALMVTPVPEAATWAQLITGFMVAGVALRRSRARRAKWMALVGRLSGRVRESA